MKRWLLYVLVLAVTLLLPVKRTDVGKLRPVQVISIYKEGDAVVIETDTEDKGVGETALQALENLKQTTPATVYLDTADYLLLTEQTHQAAEELRYKLKKSVRLCQTNRKMDLKLAASYLAAHENMPTLKDWEAGEQLPELSMEENRMILS